MKRVAFKNPIDYCGYYRGIMFQLPQNDILYLVGTRNWKTCLLLYASCDSHKSRDEQQIYGAKTVELLHLFFKAKDRLHSN